MSFIHTAWRRASGNPETLAATGAALITGAAVFLMPTQLLQNAVLASGLPAMFPPLDPPLGFKAKAGLALIAAGFTFGLVALLTRLVLGRGFMSAKAAKPAKTAKAANPDRVAKVAKAAAIEEELPPAPRLRRRDRHPDAPARAPISISRDIVSEDDRPLFAAETAVLADPIEEIEVEPFDFVEATEPQFVEHAPVAHAAPVIEPAPAPHRARPAWQQAEAPAAEASLSDLLERLERAMERRPAATTAPDNTSPVPVPAPAFHPPADDDRLRSALESLKRFAPQRG